MNIAVTGGLGSGKSTVSKVLANAISADLLDTDELCREQMRPGMPGFVRCCQVFGTRYLQSDGSLDRQLLRQAVFTDNQVKKDLEKILHPLVRQQVAACTAHCADHGRDLVVEVPLLFEVGWQNDFDVTVAVYVADELCRQRVAARDGLTAVEIGRVLAAQMPIADKIAAAHFVIDNSGTMVSTIQQIAWLGKKLQSGGICREMAT